MRRYIEIKQSDLPSAVAAKKTREFRCPPREQVSVFVHALPLLDFCLPNIVAVCYIKQRCHWEEYLVKGSLEAGHKWHSESFVFWTVSAL